MATLRTALVHVKSQIIEKWLPPPPLGAGAGGSAFVPQGDWLDAGFWTDLLVGEADMTAEERYRVAVAASGHFRFLHEEGGWYVPFWCSDYPPLLRFIPDPPAALSVLGDKVWLTRRAVAVVGSRKATAFALAQAVALGKELASRGVVVASGGALGCDIASHWGALGGTTGKLPAVAVFAGGLQSLYPRRNQHIFAQMRMRGAAFVSERLWNAPSRPRDFPVRNRVISGLAPLTVVAQAGAKSGAYITARWALDQGRDVSVLRHPEGDIRSAGSERLIDDGARAFDRPADIMEMCEAFLEAIQV